MSSALESKDMHDEGKEDAVNLSEYDDLVSVLEKDESQKSQRHVKHEDDPETKGLLLSLAESAAMKSMVRLFQRELAKTAYKATQHPQGAEMRGGMLQEKLPPTFQEIMGSKKRECDYGGLFVEYILWLSICILLS